MGNEEKYTEHKIGDELRLDYKSDQINYVPFMKEYTSKLKLVNNKLNLLYNKITSNTISDLLDDYSLIIKSNDVIGAYYSEIQKLESKASKSYDKLCNQIAKEKGVNFDDLSISIDGKDLDILISEMTQKLKMKVDSLEDVINGLNKFLSNGSERRILSAFDDIEIIKI